MAQAEFELTTAESFAAFATFLGTPLPEDPIQALRILRREAAAEVERLIAFLDALGGDPDLEDGDDDEEEASEPSLGWTSTFNQASRHRLGDNGPFSFDAEAEHDGREPDVDDEEGHDAEGTGLIAEGLQAAGAGAVAPSEAYRQRLAVRRGERRQRSRVQA